MKGFVTALFLFIFGIVSPAPAQDELTFAMLPETNPMVVFKRDIALLLGKRLNAAVTIVHVPPKRRYTSLQTGDCDMSLGLLKTTAYTDFVYFVSTPYQRKANKVFFLLKGSDATINRHEDLHGLTIGTVRGKRTFPEFDDDARIEKDISNDLESNFRKLLLGRVDAVVTQDSTAVEIISEMERSDKKNYRDKLVIADYKYTSENPVFLGISKKSPWMKKIDQVEKAFKEMVQSGETDEMIERYYKDRNMRVPDYR